MSRRDPYHCWRGKRLSELRAVYESNIGTLCQISTAYECPRGYIQKLAKRDGWRHSRPTGRPVGYRQRAEVVVARFDRRAITLRTIMLEAIEGRE